MTTLRIKEIIGTPNAILQKFGFQLFEKIDSVIAQDKRVTISFYDIQNLTSGFMNASFGKLYKKYGIELDQIVSLTDINDPDWMEKFQDAKSLALNPGKADLIDAAIADLFD